MLLQNITDYSYITAFAGEHRYQCERCGQFIEGTTADKVTEKANNIGWKQDKDRSDNYCSTCVPFVSINW